jgi:hypothetical protein
MASTNGYIGAPGGTVVSSNINTYANYPMINTIDADGFQITNLGDPVGPSSIVRVCDLSGGSFHWSLVPAISDTNFSGYNLLNCGSISSSSISTNTVSCANLSTINISTNSVFSGSLSTPQAFVGNLTVGSINVSTITNSAFVTNTTPQLAGTYPGGNLGMFGPTTNVNAPYQEPPVYSTSKLNALKNASGDIIPQRIDMCFQLNTDITGGNNLYTQAFPGVYDFTPSVPFSGNPVIPLPEDYGFSINTPNIFTSKYGSPITYWNTVCGTCVIPSTIGLGGQIYRDLAIQWRFSCDGSSGEFYTSGNTPMTWTNIPL